MKILNLLLAGCLLLANVPLMTSCDDDDNDKKPTLETFTEDAVINWSYDGSVKADEELVMYEGETARLVIKDGATNETLAYSHCQWSCDNEEVVSISEAEGNYAIVIANSAGEANVTVTDEAGEKTLSQRIIVKQPETYSAKIDYSIYMMTDLLQFVSVEVIFTEDGEETGRVMLNQDDFIKHEDEVMTIGEETIHIEQPQTWDSTLCYNRWGLTAKMIMRYIPTGNMTLEKDVYDLEHGMGWSKASSLKESSSGILKTDFSSTSISLSVGGNDPAYEIRKENVAEYILQLAAHPDTLTTRISENGEIKMVEK